MIEAALGIIIPPPPPNFYMVKLNKTSKHPTHKLQLVLKQFALLIERELTVLIVPQRRCPVLFNLSPLFWSFYALKF